MKPQSNTRGSVIESIANTRRALGECVDAYLSEARLNTRGERALALEAVAIERALVAAAMEDLLDRSEANAEKEKNADGPEAENEPVFISQSNQNLRKASERLMRSSASEANKGLARDIRSSVVGLCFPDEERSH